MRRIASRRKKREDKRDEYDQDSIHVYKLMTYFCVGVKEFFKKTCKKMQDLGREEWVQLEINRDTRG